MLRYMEKGKSPEDVSTDPAEYGRGKRPKKAADYSYPGENDTSSKSQSNSSDDSDQQSTPDSPITTKKVARRPQQLVPPLVPVSKPIIPDFVSSDNDIYGGDEESAQRIDHSPVFRPRLSPTLFVESGKRSLTNSKGILNLNQMSRTTDAFLFVKKYGISYRTNLTPDFVFIFSISCNCAWQKSYSAG